MTPGASRFALYPRPPFRLDVTVVVLRRNAVNVVDRWDADSSIYRRVLVVDGSAVEVAVESVGTTEAPRLAVSVAPRNRTESASRPLPGCCASCSASTSIWIPSTGAPPAKSGRRSWRASPASSRRSCRRSLRRWSAASRASSSHSPRACTCWGASATPTACSSVDTTHFRDLLISCGLRPRTFAASASARARPRPSSGWLGRSKTGASISRGWRVWTRMR